VSEELANATLVFVRHGQARSADGSYTSATPLSALGRRQALAVADRLIAETSLAAIYTSPHLRAVETAEPVSGRFGLKPIVDSRLAEFEIGDLPMAEFADTRPDLLLWEPHHRAKPGEASLAEFSARIAAFCEETAKRHLGENVLITAHAGTIDGVIRWAVGLPSSSPWQHEFDLSNGSITEIRFWPRGRVPGGSPRYAVLACVGDSTHLRGFTSDL
jgi:broad specificity phosphatase PhoE